MNWIETLRQIFKAPDLRKKIIFVLGIFAIFRVMANIPVPGVSVQNLEGFFNQYGALGLLNAFTGGALDRLSIIMLGLGPYITATIIFQLLTMIFPQLEKIYKEEGEAGRQKFNQYARIATVPLAILQAYTMLIFFERQGLIGAISPLVMLASVATISGGALFLMWLGELISEKGIGNGVSLLIFAGIIADFPNNIQQMIIQIQSFGSAEIPVYLLFFVIALIIVGGVVIINEARRNIPVSYAKRVRGMKMYGGAQTYLPLNINPAGVIPIIFALSILLIPGMMGNLLAGNAGAIGNIAGAVSHFFQNPWIYGILFFFLVVVFTFFYTAVTFDPKSISQNLQKMGGFIPGIRPGESTANFMQYILNRVLLIGALFLGLIAVLPSIIQGSLNVQQFGFLIGGTSLLIIVSVVLETVKAVKAQLQMREYESF